MGWLQAIFYSTSKNQEGDSPNFDEIVLIYQPIFGREINLPNRSQMMTTRVLSEDEISRFQSDGVAYVEQAVEGKWVEALNHVVDQQLDKPGRWANDGNPGNKSNRMFTDRYLWQENSSIRDFVHHSGCARLAALSTRWLGDDAIWHPHAGADRTVTQEQVAVNPGDTPVDDSIFPCVWQDS